MLVNRLSEQRGFVCGPSTTFEVHAQLQGHVSWQIARPVHDELLRIRIQVTLAERRRIDGIEELPELCYANFNDARTGRDCVTAGRR